MTPFVVIGCGKEKRALAPGETCRAIDLYTGPLFLARLAHARALGGPHAILSASHVVLEIDAQVGSYELDLRKQTKRDRIAWGERAAGIIAARAHPLARIVVLASGPYGDVVAYLRARFQRDAVALGEGMQIGELLAYHRGEAARLAACEGTLTAESPPGLTTEGGLDWWLAERERRAIVDTDVCEVRGDVMCALLDAYRERATARAA